MAHRQSQLPFAPLYGPHTFPRYSAISFHPLRICGGRFFDGRSFIIGIIGFISRDEM